MNTAAHPVAPEQIMALLDGELPAAQAPSVSDHLKQCPECIAIAAQFRNTSQSLAWKVPAVPAKLENTLLKLAAKDPSAAQIGKTNIFIRASFWSWKQWTAGLGATAVVLLLLFAIASTNEPHSKMGVNETSAIGQRPAEQTKSDGGIALTNRVQALNSPGVAGDSNGLFHGFGDHAANSFTIRAMIARTASLSIIVKDFAASRVSLDSILTRHHGYAAQLNASTSENAPRSITASLRVPANELAATLAELKSIGHVETESQSGEEVTQQHADLVARLKNSRETEQRLQAILLQRTGRISDVLAVEQEISRVRGEIEQMEAEQTSLEHRVDFAAIELQIREEYKAKLNNASPSASTRIHNSLVAGYKNAEETLLGFVLFFAESGPTLLIWLVILLLPLLLLVRRYRQIAAAS